MRPSTLEVKFQRNHSVKAELGTGRLEVPKNHPIRNLNAINLKHLQQNIATAVASVQVLSSHLRPETSTLQSKRGHEEPMMPKVPQTHLVKQIMQNKDFIQFNEIQSRQAMYGSKTN